MKDHDFLRLQSDLYLTTVIKYTREASGKLISSNQTVHFYFMLGSRLYKILVIDK